MHRDVFELFWHYSIQTFPHIIAVCKFEAGFYSSHTWSSLLPVSSRTRTDKAKPSAVDVWTLATLICSTVRSPFLISAFVVVYLSVIVCLQVISASTTGQASSPRQSCWILKMWPATSSGSRQTPCWSSCPTCVCPPKVRNSRRWRGDMSVPCRFAHHRVM